MPKARDYGWRHWTDHLRQQSSFYFSPLNWRKQSRHLQHSNWSGGHFKISLCFTKLGSQSGKSGRKQQALLIKAERELQAHRNPEIYNRPSTAPRGSWGDTVWEMKTLQSSHIWENWKTDTKGHGRGILEKGLRTPWALILGISQESEMSS